MTDRPGATPSAPTPTPAPAQPTTPDLPSPEALSERRRGAVADLLTLLDLERLEVNLFRGRSADEGWIRVFGGQVIAQALVAAQRTVEADRPCHSLHAYFIRPGDPKAPIVYEVARDRDGKSFSTRRVVAIQHGETILNLAASFQTVETGFEHQFPLPAVKRPDELPNEDALRLQRIARVPEPMRKHFLRARPVEFRPVDPRDWFDEGKGEPYQHNWFRIPGPLPDDVHLHQALLAYASDMSLLDTCRRPHGVSWTDRRLQSASLDHALWFHDPFRVDQWLLYAQDSPKASGARGLNRGLIYTEEGRLVVTAMQEGLIRWRETRGD